MTARPIRRNAQTPDRNGKIVYTSTTSLSHISKRSENVFELKAGTLYPLLHSLEDKNLLTSYEQEASGKVRKYYHITKEGEKLLKQKREEWNQYAKAVTNVLAFEM